MSCCCGRCVVAEAEIALNRFLQDPARLAALRVHTGEGSAAQQKVQILLQRGEGIVIEEFEPVAGGEPDSAE